jgi:prepilin-type N-terminal cleavage/methylation domain-containing protein
MMMDKLWPRFNPRRSRGLSKFMRRPSFGFTLVELLVVIAIIGILVALLLPAIQAAREAARRAQCQSNAHNIALAVLNYEAAKKSLPPGMTFDTSLAGSVETLTHYGPNWVILTLPYLESQELYDLFDFDTPPSTSNTKRINAAGAVVANVNRTARGTSIPVMLCPSDSNNRVMYNPTGAGMIHSDNWARGNYAANAGRAYVLGTAGADRMSGPTSAGWKDDCQRGVMGPNISVNLKRITDGTTKTIMLGEIRAGLTDQDSRGVWALGAAGASVIAMYGSGGDDNGPNICTTLSDDVYADAGVCTGTKCASDGNSLFQSACMNCNYGDRAEQAAPRSMHTGGVYLAMCDGSVQFVSNDIETTGCIYSGTNRSPWDNMIASADGEGRTCP